MIPERAACQTAMALAGAVVSNPTAKKTILRLGLSFAIFTASMGEYTTRTSAPLARLRTDPICDPGTRNMSPYEVKVTLVNPAMWMAWSISSRGVTHTGHPGP